jgi:hypothetical protein
LLLPAYTEIIKEQKVLFSDNITGECPYQAGIYVTMKSGDHSPRVTLTPFSSTVKLSPEYVILDDFNFTRGTLYPG